jgi:hypothetical protein
MKKYYFFILFFLLFVAITLAFITSDGYKVRGVISSGGSMNLTATGYILRTVSGQPLAGNAGDGYRICFGFLCMGGISQTSGEYSIDLSGYLNYSNGTPVKNTKIEVTIKYPGPSYVATNTTGDDGYFFVRVENIPEYLAGDDFDISIRVLGEVEALYESHCTYSSTDKKYYC